MADYCDIDDVQNAIPTLVLRDAVLADEGPPAVAAVEASVPSLTQAGVLMSMVGAELDGVLCSRGYSLPIPDAETVALGQLKSAQICGAAARILRAAFPDDEGPGGDAGSAKFWNDAYERTLNALQSGALLVDAPLEESHVSEGFTTTSAGDPYVPRIRREMEW